MFNNFHSKKNHYSNGTKCETDASNIDPLASFNQAARPPYLCFTNSYGPTKGGSKTPTLRFFIKTKSPGTNLTTSTTFLES